MTACRYCGFDAPRMSDEDCPARLRNRLRRYAWLLWLSPVVALYLYAYIHGPVR